MWTRKRTRFVGDVLVCVIGRVFTDAADSSVQQGFEMVKDDMLGTYTFGHHMIFMS